MPRANTDAKRNKLFVDKLAKSISVTAPSGVPDLRFNSAQGAPLDRNSALDRISRLVEFIQSRSLQASDSHDNAIDGALQEIGRLIGMPVRPGGSGRAVVSGVNRHQIESYEVISLRPNAEITLSGNIHGGRSRAVENGLGVLGQSGWRIVTTDIAGLNSNQIASLNAGSLRPGSEVAVTGSLDVVPASAQLIYQGVGGALASGTASFRITGPNGNKNFSITGGEPLLDIAQRINDESAATGVVAAVQGNTIALRTITTGATAAIVVDNIVRDSVVTVSALNGAQVDDFEVVSIPDETEITLNGNVTQAATRATLTYVGASGGVVVDSATFTLSGDLGSAPISIVQGESLADVANRINLLSQTTGVSAATSGDYLVLSSLNIGSAADIAVALDEITQYLNVSGVNPSQITNFQVQSADPDSVNTLSGSVTQVATAAQLTYTGSLGRITANASFTLTGSLGSANFSVTLLETLTAVRDRINLQTANTGVTASVSGNNLFLTSTGVGSAATVSRLVTSGTFNVTGGDGNGTANGTNAQLQINGQPVTATGNNVTYSDALGSYTFTLVNGFTGAFNTITVTSANGTFNITGGDGNGADTGSDAQATINGQPLTASGNQFTINTGGGQFLLELANGFSGALDPIVITSSLADFTISGGNGDSTANGVDAQATINGQSLTSANRVFTLTTPGGNLIIDFQDAFLGAFDPFTVAVREQSIAPTTQNSASPRSSARPAKATINGRTVKQKDGRFLINQDGVEIAIKFARGFRGKFDDITVSAAGDESESATSILGEAEAARVRSLIEPLLSLASGGINSNLSQNGGRAFRLAASALSELITLRSGNLTANRRSLTSGALLDQLA